MIRQVIILYHAHQVEEPAEIADSRCATSRHTAPVLAGRHQARRCLAPGRALAYLRTQLHALTDGERHNGINCIMRGMARRTTPEEIDQAARF
jgi:cytochrome c553